MYSRVCRVENLYFFHSRLCIPGYVVYEISIFSFPAMYSRLCRIENLPSIPDYVFPAMSCRKSLFLHSRLCIPGYVVCKISFLIPGYVENTIPGYVVPGYVRSPKYDYAKQFVYITCTRSALKNLARSSSSFSFDIEMWLPRSYCVLFCAQLPMNTMGISDPVDALQ